MPIEVEQHNLEIQANAEHWRRKPLLQRIYRDFYGEIAGELRNDLPGETVEIGSGIGNLKAVVPKALATDIFPNPWLDRVENAYAMSFEDGSVANLILFDVWHHLEYPAAALAEFHRVLVPQGRLIIFDPAMGLLGRIVYGLFHHEPLGLKDKIQWQTPADFSPEKMTYYAAQGNAQRIFFFRRRRPGTARLASYAAESVCRHSLCGFWRFPRAATLSGKLAARLARGRSSGKPTSRPLRHAAPRHSGEKMISSLLYDLNHAPIWQRGIRVWDRRIRAASLDRLVFLALHRAGLMGKEEMPLLAKLVTPGMQILDVGANIGLYTMLLARLAGDDGRVFAFEPEPNLFSILCENCAANNAANVTPFQCAAGDANGRTTFQRATFNSGDNRLGGSKPGAQSIEVEVARLDDVLPVRTVQFIKLDVQGHELAALTGMQQVIASSPDVRVLFEFWPAGLRAANATPELLFKFFHERGFLISELEKGQARELDTPASLLSKLGDKRYTNLLASRTPLVTL